MGPLEMELLATIGNALVYPGDFDLCLFPVVRPFPFSRPPGLQPSQLALQGFETLGPFPADAIWQGVLLTVIRREGCIGRQDGLLQLLVGYASTGTFYYRFCSGVWRGSMYPGAHPAGRARD